MKRSKLIPIGERNPLARCWFCRTNKSVKYTAEFINPNLKSNNRYMKIYLCNKCALIHNDDLREIE